MEISKLSNSFSLIYKMDKNVSDTRLLDYTVHVLVTLYNRSCLIRGDIYATAYDAIIRIIDTDARTEELRWLFNHLRNNEDYKEFLDGYIIGKG